MSRPSGKIAALSVSSEKGVAKTNVETVVLKVEHGIEGDAHGGPWHRQVSLLAMESVRKMQSRGAEVQPGSFAENITTESFDLSALHPGDRLEAGETMLEITQIGKECHAPCAIYQQVGDCVMPKEGIFARVLRGGMLRVGEEISVLGDQETEARSEDANHDEGGAR